MSQSIHSAKMASHGRTQQTTPRAFHKLNYDSSVDSDGRDGSDDEWWDDEMPVLSKASIAPTESSRMTQWPVTDTPSHTKPKPHISSQLESKQYPRKYSVHKLSREKSKQRQRIQNAKAGIKVVTNFSRHHGPTPVVQAPPKNDSRPRAQAGRFIDLAALQALESEDSENAKSFWQSVKGTSHLRNPSSTDGGASKARSQTATNAGNGKVKRVVPAPLKLEEDLSPNDRPIVIGISLPSAKLRVDSHTANLNTGNLQPNSNNHERPETPTIIVTPAPQASVWDPLDSASLDAAYCQTYPRAPSSVYSSCASISDFRDSDLPPVPQLPSAFANITIKKDGARDSVATVFDEDITPVSAHPRKSRTMSASTCFEEDETPIFRKRPNSAGYDSQHTGVSSLDHRASKGWWNYITTPFLTRSSTFASQRTIKDNSPPAVPSILDAANKAATARDMREWEKAFSPMTPETSTTIASDAWWESRKTLDGMPKSEVLEIPKSPADQDSQCGTLPFMLASPERSAEQVPALPLEHIQGCHRREDSSNTVMSPSDRETPFMLDVSSLGAGNAPRQEKRNVQISDRPAAASIAVVGPLPRAVEAVSSAGLEGEPRELPGNVAPPPYSPQRKPHVPKYRVVLPPNHRSNMREPQSPGPVSPGLQRAMASTGHIPMSDVPLTPASDARPVNSNLRYVHETVVNLNFAAPPTKASKVEKKRQKHEKEDAIVHKAGGLWRGRGCVPKRGCYGRSGAEGRKRRRCWIGLFIGFLSMIILIVVLATQLHRGTSVSQPSQWLNLTGYPPIFTGVSTIAAPANTVVNSGCVFPSTLWSCALPKELQQSNSDPNTPSFKLQIIWDNSTEANATFSNITGNTNLSSRSLVGNAVSAGYFRKHIIQLLSRRANLTPSPPAPSLAEQVFLGNTTDSIVSTAKAGEATPFYITFLSTTPTSPTNTTVQTRATNTTSQGTNLFPNLTSLIPPPSLNPDGTASPAALLPLPINQPLRLYDRGLPTEHYGFYSYFSRSIFLQSPVLSSTNATFATTTPPLPADQFGGSPAKDARFRCDWAQTRFHVQMWTRKGPAVAALLNSTSTSPTASAAALTRPGTFPLLTTLTVDRHGGDAALKLVYCYALAADGSRRVQSGADAARIWPEFRANGGSGVIVNPAGTLLSIAGDDGGEDGGKFGGVDGGDTGCACSWQNWNAVVGGKGT